MKKSLNLSMVATLVLGVLSYNIANAQVASSSVKNETANIAKSDSDKVRIFVNNQQRSLYQIALLSNISIAELRSLNKGSFDGVDVVKVGESIVLPADSPLLPVETKKTEKDDKYSYLPNLGSSDNVDLTTNNSVETQVATVLQTLGQQDWENMTADKVKEDINNRTQDYAENYVRNQVHSQVIDPIRSAAQDFLGRFGTAQLQFDVSDQAKLNNVNVKLFSPWYDSESTLIFSQLTYQEYEQDRRIGNFGIGQRWDVADKNWLIGYNVFFDHDFSRNHNRLGLGLEAWSDYMKFAANYYTPLSDWKDSKDFDDYLERAARGYDVRFQGYLPSYPHLGASLMFEQYFGDKVALFGKDNLQKDPYAVTVGVDYTPVPLFTIKGEHKQGENANKMAKVELTMNYRIGVPLKDQLDPNMVDVARSLKGSRYDLVDRNNYIVLEYKEKKFSVDLASLGEWEETTILPVGIAVHNAKGTLSPLSWNVNNPFDLPALIRDGGDLCYTSTCSSSMWGISSVAPPMGPWVATTNDTANWTIVVPAYLDANGQRNPVSGTSQAGRYTFDVTLTDGNGRTATSNTSWLAVKPSTSRQVLLNNISSIPAGGTGPLGSLANPAPADGTTTVILQANLVQSSVTVNPGILPGNVAGFTDHTSLLEYPIDTSSAGQGPWGVGTTFQSTSPTTEDIKAINKLYTATAGGNKVTFVADPNGTNQCPAEIPQCLIVKSITAVVGSSTISDDYRIEVSTNAALGAVDISFRLSAYSDPSSTSFRPIPQPPTPTTIVFDGGTPAKLEIYNGANLIGSADNSRVFTMSGILQVNDQFTLKVEDSAGNDITSRSNIVWSLVGDNISACNANGVPSNTILRGDTNSTGDDPTGTLLANILFNVSHTSTYQLQGSTSLASTTGVGLNGVSISGLAMTGSANTTLTCAGDQGFKLRIDVN